MPSHSVLISRPKLDADKSGSNEQSGLGNMPFDMVSRNSAFFLQDDELEAYEEKMEQRIQEVFGSIEKQ